MLSKFTVNRKTWLRGKDKGPGGEEGSCLLRKSDGKMCCLGQYCRAAKIPKDKIEEVSTPEMVGENKKLLAFLTIDSYENYYINTVTCERLISINDDENISDKMREYRLKRKFGSLGISVSFKG